jgi:predicted HAD superfamily Cof-like phosphohydrolase
MSDIFADQRKFMKACGQTVEGHNTDQFDMYIRLVAEETAELVEAVGKKDPVETLDALIDILVVATGAIHSMGADAEGAWKEVMRSNFDKVDQRTGRVNKREDGKVLKPENWEPPNLKRFVKTT